MTKRGLKRIFVFSFYFSLFLVIIWGIWYLFIYEKKVDICGDGVCGQTESYSFCPTDCPAPSIWENLEVVKTTIISISENTYDSAFLIKNPNGAGGVKDLLYRIQYLGEGEGEIAFREGHTFILPGEVKYIFEMNIESPQKITNAQISFKDIEWKKLKSEIYREPEIRIKNKIFSFDEGRNEYRLIGRVQNASTFDFNRVFVQTALIGEGGKIIGLNYTVQGALLAGEEREFEFYWPKNEIKEEVKGNEVIAEVNVFDSENFMKRYGEPEAP